MQSKSMKARKGKLLAYKHMHQRSLCAYPQPASTVYVALIYKIDVNALQALVKTEIYPLFTIIQNNCIDVPEIRE